jgi:LPS export ABC transporter protein LptC
MNVHRIFRASTPALFALLAACGRAPSGGTTPASPSPSPPPAASSATPLEVYSHAVGAKYIYVTEQKRSRKVYVLRADEQRAQYFGTGTGRSDFTNPHVIFYDAPGKTLTADAPAGTVFERDKTVVMTGGVRARTSDGKTLTCNTLHYNDATGRLLGEGNVVLTSPLGEQLRGQRLDADVRLSKLVMTGAEGAP